MLGPADVSLQFFNMIVNFVFNSSTVVLRKGKRQWQFGFLHIQIPTSDGKRVCQTKALFKKLE
jgi:hypothetical protein